MKSVRTRSLIKLNLEDLSPNPSAVCYYNLSYGEIADNQARNKEGLFAHNGAFAVGKFTGRSPNDKYIVDSEPSTSRIWWGDINRKMSVETYTQLKDEVMFYYKNKVDNVYVLDAFCGAHKNCAKKVRFITEKAWHHHFVKNMFIEAKPEELKDFEPDFTVINCYGLTDEHWKKHGLHSDVYAAFSIEERTAIIGGAWYGGEMKKGIINHF